MRTDHRRCQPFAVPNRGTAISVDALSLMLGGSGDRALAFIPALDFSPSFPVGSVALFDGHERSERESTCPNQDGVNPHRNGAIAS